MKFDKMDRHKRFLAHPTTELSHLKCLDIPKYDRFWIKASRELISKFMLFAPDNFLIEDASECVKTIHTLLCLCYQEKVKPRSNRGSNNQLMYIHYETTLEKIHISKLQKFLDDELLNEKMLPLLLDIFVLRMVIYPDILLILGDFENLQELMKSYYIKNKNVRLLDIKLMICYMDSFILYQMNSPLKELEVEQLSTILMDYITIWFRWKERKECQLLPILIAKIIKVIRKNEILSEMWEIIFTPRDEPCETLSILCLTADIWFPMESENDEQLINQAMGEPFWLLLLKGLSNPIPQQRKQALYLIKRVVDFVVKHKTHDLELSNYHEVRPLICTGNDSQQNSFRKNLNNFFLILEALEEKQKHLVLPVLPLLANLVEETFVQQDKKTEFHIAWIRCVFLRILQHENNAIVRWGLLNVPTVDLELYNDEFLDKFLDVLNNTYLYENDSNTEDPTIVEEISIFLNYAESLSHDFLTRFLVKVSKINWGPIALFYVIHTLSRSRKVSSTWTETELEAVKSLAEFNLAMHCRILRIGSQIELLEAMVRFATKSLDLAVVANTLSAFPTSEALIRGQLAWKRISAWLSKIIKEEEAVSFLERICGQMMSDNTPSDLSVKSFSLIIMLLYDGHVVLNSMLCPGLTALRNLLDCLNGAATKPCADGELRNRLIQLISNLLELMSPEDHVLRELVSDYVDATLKFIFERLRNMYNETNIDNINTYGFVTQQFFTPQNSISQKLEVLEHIEKFEVEAQNIIEDGEYTNNVRRFFGIQILNACVTAGNKKYTDYKFIGPLCKTYKTFMTQSFKNKEDRDETLDENTKLTGKIAARYYKFAAELFHMYVKNEPVDRWIPEIDWIEEALYLIQVGGKDIFVPTIGMLSHIFYQGAITATNIDNFKSTLRLCWKSTLEFSECRLAVEEIVNLILSSPFLESKETKELTIECIHEMMDKGDKIPGLIITVLQGLKQAEAEYLSNFYDTILTCLLYGTVPRRDQKIELQARAYVFDCYVKVYPNYLSTMHVNTNAAIRAHAITLLHKMINEDVTHAAKLLPLIISKLEESHNKRYFGDSQIHRIRNRIMQVLLLLQPILQEQDDIESLHLLMCNNMVSGSSQPSVRIMQEWLLIRIYLQSEALRCKIWNLFDQGQDKRVGSLCSVIGVTYHVAQSLTSDLQLDFINIALKYIAPCCMAQQFNVRLYAQVVASKLYDLAVKRSYPTVTEKYSELYTALTKSLKYGNLMKNSSKLKDDFYLVIFNPLDDYSLQTLFYELPRLSNVSLDECIPHQMFEKFGFKKSNSHPLKLLNLNSSMSQAHVSEHILKSSGSAGPIADELDGSNDGSTDMQKKFIPWKTMMPNEDDLNEVSEALASCRTALTEGNNIILVASLVEKLPNLGGLSRTSEILGVKEFVVSSIKHTEDREFQSLSVSAEKLIPLVEVKPHQLQHYLLEKKSIGYRLVGAEQTVNSTNLMDVKFDPKTVLLLGNEKAGIPANLIPLLDECVEIPQVGVVRSFNVHVTGAMCLWEYFKQHHHSS